MSPDFFEKDQNGLKPFWSGSIDAKARELCVLARTYLSRITDDARRKHAWNYAELETCLRNRQVAVESLDSYRVDHFQVPEIADFADVELDEPSREFYAGSELLLKRILTANGLEEQMTLARELQAAHPRRVSVPVLKWLANTAERAEEPDARFRKEARAARSFLRNFADRYFNELRGGEILNAYADWVEQRAEEMTDRLTAAMPTIQLVALLRGGRVLGGMMRARGLVVCDLLFTKAMAESFGIEPGGTGTRLTAAGMSVLKRYLDLHHIPVGSASHILFLDIGSKGTLHSFLRQALEFTSIPSSLFLLYHADEAAPQNDRVEGLNDDPKWCLHKKFLWWHAFMLNDGLEQAYEVSSAHAWTDAALLHPPVRDTPRQWYAKVCDEAIRQFLASVQQESERQISGLRSVREGADKSLLGSGAPMESIQEPDFDRIIQRLTESNQAYLAEVLSLKGRARARIIGITGPPASGKSAAARHLALMGFPVIEVDQFARANLPVDIGKAMVRRFGAEILNPDEGINLAYRLSNEATLRESGRLIMPYRLNRLFISLREMLNVCPDGRVIIVEASYLYRLGLSRLLDAVWYIRRSEENRSLGYKSRESQKGVAPGVIDRLFEFIRSVEDSHETFLKGATLVLENDGTLSSLFDSIDLALAAFLSADLPGGTHTGTGA